MAARSIADISLSFGLVSIPVKVYSATDSSEKIRFNFLHTCGSRVRQQYICIREQKVIDRSEMVKGYEFAKDQYVVFEPEELKALEEKGTHTVDIVAFVPQSSIDPIFFDKAYYLAPDKRGDRPYALLWEGMRRAERCALARWAWKGRSYTVVVRPSDEGGLVLQQLLYADEVRSMKELKLPDIDIKPNELELAMQLIQQIAQDEFDPGQFEDEMKKRVEKAIDEKIEGKQISITEEPEPTGGQVIDLMEALRQSLAKKGAAARQDDAGEPAPKARKSAKRVAGSATKTAAKSAPAKTRAKK